MADVLIAVFFADFFFAKCCFVDENLSINRRNCSPHVATRYKSLNSLVIVLKNELPCSEKKSTFENEIRDL